VFRKLTGSLCILVAVTFVFTLLPNQVDSACTRYPSSRPLWFAGYGLVCGGSGPGCTECIWGDQSCVTDGESCTANPFNQRP
jgi:hypothetical protein